MNERSQSWIYENETHHYGASFYHSTDRTLVQKKHCFCGALQEYYNTAELQYAATEIMTFF